MAEPIHVDFRARRRIAQDSLRRLKAAASAVRMFLDRETDADYAVDVVIPDPCRDRRPYLMISSADLDIDLEERISTTWGWIDFDFVWCCREDLPQ
jgi:hypothetical protein